MPIFAIRELQIKLPEPPATINAIKIYQIRGAATGLTELTRYARIPRILGLRMRTHRCTLTLRSIPMTTIKVGVREFRERIASFLESDTPVAVTRRGETLGVYVPTRRKRPKTAHMSELKEAADRLASALADVDEEELVAEFKELRRRGKGASR